MNNKLILEKLSFQVEPFDIIMSDRFTFSLLTTTAILIISACQKEKLLGEYYLSNDDKLTVPYSVGDSIRFVTNEHDTIDLLCHLRYSEVSREYISYNKYYTYERDVTKINTDEYYLSCQLSTIGMYPSMKLHWSDLDNHRGLVNFNLPLIPNNLKYGQYIVQEMFVRNTLYHNVFVDSTAWRSGPEIDNELKTFYYSIEFGIIKLEFENGDFWEIDSTSYIQRVI